MRVLILSSEFPPGPGGIGTHAWQLARHLRDDHGWEVAVISRQDYVSGDEAAAFNAAQSFQIEPLRPVASTLRDLVYRLRVAMRWIERWRPDVILATGGRMVWLAALLALRYRQPFVAIGHGTEFGVSSWEHRLTRWAFQRTDLTICVSEFTRAYMQRAGIHPRRVEIIPNGADGQQYRRLPDEAIRAFRAQEKLDSAQVLVTVGHVSERKGQDTVIRAMPRVLEEAPEAHYYCLGLPTLQGDYAALARDLGVAGHVHFPGRVDSDRLLGYLNASDIFIMTSRHTATGDFEGYGIAVVEAALCGTPAVVSDNSGLVEAIVDGQTGLVVPADDPDATAGAILRLLLDDDRRRAMGAAAQERASAEQTWDRRAARYHTVLAGLAAGSPGRPR